MARRVRIKTYKRPARRTAYSSIYGTGVKSNTTKSEQKTVSVGVQKFEDEYQAFVAELKAKKIPEQKVEESSFIGYCVTVDDEPKAEPQEPAVYVEEPVVEPEETPVEEPVVEQEPVVETKKSKKKKFETTDVE